MVVNNDLQLSNKGVCYQHKKSQIVKRVSLTKLVTEKIPITSRQLKGKIEFKNWPRPWSPLLLILTRSWWSTRWWWRNPAFFPSSFISTSITVNSQTIVVTFIRWGHHSLGHNLALLLRWQTIFLLFLFLQHFTFPLFLWFTLASSLLAITASVAFLSFLWWWSESCKVLNYIIGWNRILVQKKMHYFYFK